MIYTIIELLQSSLRAGPDSPAILSGSGTTLSYAHLIRQIEKTVQQLRAAGLERNDRVAVVLPNGPEMAVSFLAVASACACAPLNPAYRADEFDIYLSDLGAKALILLHESDTPSRDVAAKRGIRVLELLPDEGAAGGFDLADVPSTEARPQFADAEDIALILHTSGTTSKPKMVPLTHRNLTASAQHIRTTLQLTAADRCLNVMPLFHIHGLIGALLASMAGGGSIVCTAGFEAPQFFDWFSEFRPTWYTAVPAIHQAILARARDRKESIEQGCLRFIRSSSSPLSSQLAREMETVFAAPVIDSYGMTEASHQMTSNPLPPARRKPGSVGRPGGPQIAIMDETGNLLPEAAVGEVVIRGQNVTLGYDSNPDANRLAYHDEWFRTGDQGYLDSEGYLFLTGRLKEVINRGGEKISPREIDDVLLQHPLVEEAITFALPDAKLGEDVGAAVVLRTGQSTSELELKEYVADRLADFKTPRRVLILNAIPKGPTGKPQRVGLAERLGLAVTQSSTSTNPVPIAPTTETEVRLCDLWKEILRIDQVGVEDDFFQLGGDSILATQFLARLRELTGSELKFVVFFSSPTVAAAARWMNQVRTTAVSEQRAIYRRSLQERRRASSSQEAMYFVDQSEREKFSAESPRLVSPPRSFEF